MKKVFKSVLVGLFILSMNLFGITIDTRNPDISYKKDKNNIIWTEGTGIQDQYKDYWRDYLDETEGWVDPYFVLSGLEVTSYVKYNDGREVGNHGELRDILINAEYDLQNFVRIEGTSAPIPGDRYNRTIQFKLIDEETGEIEFIFSIRNIKLLPYANISWDLDSAEIVDSYGDTLEGPDAIFYFTNTINRFYKFKNRN